jgi:hypothetical protein
MVDCEKCKVLKQIIEGQNKLLVCYRLGTQRGASGAIDKITKAKLQLAKLEQEVDE